ncbi:hypothetical protein CF68_20075 [Cupriavidus sp. SK-4]|nr:hypothetical protein CF68_20075 [Cupriavidus sp. SK-4]
MPVRGCLTLLLLAGQNLLIFWRHYFDGIAFPDDFLLTYHAIPYYWIEAVKLGKGIAWIPFQGMGYPLFLNLQSGEFYLPFWLFPLFDGTYTIHAAVVMQGAHVLLGSIGAAVCARLLGVGWRESMLAGIFYQCFGGFYSNSQHPDIVRAFAFLPWLCGPVFADWRIRSTSLMIGVVTLPMWVFAVWTGGYPGTAMATLFVLATVSVLRALRERDVSGVGVWILVALVAGTMVAGIALVPAFLSSGEIGRSKTIGTLAYDYMLPGDILSFAFPINSSYFGHDISMRSFFVGFPVVALFLMGIAEVRRRMMWPLISGLIALLMAAGPLHQILVLMIPPLGLSRFVMADYRALIGLVAILVAVTVLDDHQGGKRAGNIWPLLFGIFVWYGVHALNLERAYAKEDHIALLMVLLVVVAAILNRFAARLLGWTLEPLVFVVGAVFIWYSSYLLNVMPTPARAEVISVIRWLAILALGLNFLCSLFMKKSLEPLLIIFSAIVAAYIASTLLVARVNQNGVMIPIAITAVLTIVALSPVFLQSGRGLVMPALATVAISHWMCVTWTERYFAPPAQDGTAWVESIAGKFSDTREALKRQLRTETCRGPRHDVPLPTADRFPWSGYYSGQYFMQDYSGPMKFQRQQSILGSDDLRGFAMLPWTMVAVSDLHRTHDADLSKAPRVDAVCSAYGTTEIRYQIDLGVPTAVVENEIYSKGWSARLLCDDCGWSGGAKDIFPVDVKGFRGWQLPAGRYVLIARFDTPYRTLGMAITLLGIGLWIAIGWSIMRPKRIWLSRQTGRAIKADPS